MTLGTESMSQELNPYLSPIWVQLRNDGTDLYYDFSFDGTNFINFYTETVGFFITPTMYGFGGLSETAGGVPYVMSDALAWNTAANATL